MLRGTARMAAVTRAAFVAACRSGDLATAQSYLAQPDVARALAETERHIVAAEVDAVERYGRTRVEFYGMFQLHDAWFLGDDGWKSVFFGGPGTLQANILAWLYRAGAPSTMAMPHTLALLFRNLMAFAILEKDRLVVEALLASPTFCTFLSEPEREASLGQAVEVAVIYGVVEALDLLAAHGARLRWYEIAPMGPLNVERDLELVDLQIQNGAFGIGDARLLPREKGPLSTAYMRELQRRAVTIDVETVAILHSAAKARDLHTIQLLMDEALVDVDTLDMYGETPLMCVIYNEYDSGNVWSDKEGLRLRIVDLLLQHNADVSREDCDGQTALGLAVSVGSYDIVNRLLEAGADPNVQDRDGTTALVRAGKEELMTFDLAYLLLEHNADPTMSDNEGWTPLHRVIQHGDHPDGFMPTAELLLEHGADPNAANDAGRTPVHLAVDRAMQNFDFEVVDMLLAFGGDLTRIDNDGNEPEAFAQTHEQGRHWLDRQREGMSPYRKYVPSY